MRPQHALLFLGGLALAALVVPRAAQRPQLPAPQEDLQPAAWEIDIGDDGRYHERPVY